MITNNFKKIMATVLQSVGGKTVNGCIPVTDVNGDAKYLSSESYGVFPGSVSMAFTGSTGIQIGSGTTPATENDYVLENRIASGYVASSVTYNFNVDAYGNPYLEYLFTITNNTQEDITISEMGYVQQCFASSVQGASASTKYNFLIDRTVLDNPVTIAASESAAVKYTLKTIL